MSAVRRSINAALQCLEIALSAEDPILLCNAILAAQDHLNDASRAASEDDGVSLVEALAWALMPVPSVAEAVTAIDEEAA